MLATGKNTTTPLESGLNSTHKFLNQIHHTPLTPRERGKVRYRLYHQAKVHQHNCTRTLLAFKMVLVQALWCALDRLWHSASTRVWLSRTWLWVLVHSRLTRLLLLGNGSTWVVVTKKNRRRDGGSARLVDLDEQTQRRSLLLMISLRD